MMRSPKSLAIAVRKKNGEILVRDDEWKSIAERVWLLRRPFMRGGVVFVEALMNGMSAMRFSAEQLELDEQEEAGAEANTGDEPPQQQTPGGSGTSGALSILLLPWLIAAGGGTGAPTGGKESGKQRGSALSKSAVVLTLVLGILLAILLFKGLPHLLTYLLLSVLGTSIDIRSPIFHLLDGSIKAAVFVTYILLIARMPDIRRVFEFHGAEHKVIWAWERGAGLTVQGAQSQPRFHPRCGTSFLLIVILVSIGVFALAFPLAEPYVTFFESSLANNLVYILVKLPLMIPIAGVAYEVVRFSGMRTGRRWIKPLIWPGLALQRLTTKPPDDDQVEVALAALRRALWREQEARAGRISGTGAVLTFASADAVPLPEEGIEATSPAGA